MTWSISTAMPNQRWSPTTPKAHEQADSEGDGPPAIGAIDAASDHGAATPDSSPTDSATPIVPSETPRLAAMAGRKGGAAR
jgi:hypothetical protein